MVKQGVTFLGVSLLILSWSVMPILGLQSVRDTVSSYGTVVYPESQLGVWHVEPGPIIPSEADWVVASRPTFEKQTEDISLILNWYAVHPPQAPFNPFVTEEDLNTVEDGLKTVPTENFWGIIFICEEHYRTHVAFNDDVNTTWFGENLLGYPLYLAESPGATVDQWLDEMFLRMIRGFHDYFSSLTKVGISAGGGSIVPNWKDKSWLEGIEKSYGYPAMTFIREHYDFVVLYAYTENLEEFMNWTSQYFQLIDQLFRNQKKLWVLTRIWSGNVETWELEAMALEMKNCFDRNIAVTCYYWNNPPLEESWSLMMRARELYDAKAPYYETSVYGKNLLTGYVGDTYGWVEVSG